MQRPTRALRQCSSLSFTTHTQALRRRAFHASHRPQSPVLETVCTQAFSLMSTLHNSTGLSWVYILPITALAVRSATATPLSIWTRINLRRLREMQPLAQAWMHKVQKDVMKTNRGLGPAMCEQLIKEEHRKKSRELRQRFGIKMWAAYAPLLQIPFFLVTIETIRQMCSDKVGFLATISSWISGEEYHSTIPVQSSFATEGALWFTDLLSPDPYYVLPMALSGMLYASVAYNSRLLQGTSTSGRTESSMFTMVLKGVSIGILYVTTTMPAALLVYWTSSSAIALLTTYSLQKFMPVPPALVPCRPLNKSYMQSPVSADRQKPRSFLTKWIASNL